MSTPKHYLLDEGELIKSGDELYRDGKWVPTQMVGTRIYKDYHPYRRLAPAQTWPDPISTDRGYPTSECCQDGMILGFDDGQWKFMSPEGFKLSELKFWMRLPPKPVEPKKPDWREAWEREAYYDMVCDYGGQRWSAKDAYRLGYEAGQKAKL